MKHFSSLILVLTSFTLWGQQLNRVVTGYPKSDDVQEVYYVLATDKTIKHGDYYSFYKGELTKKELKSSDISSETLGFKEKGKYQNNLKNGDWIVYKMPRQNSSTSIYNVKLEEGKYRNDKKVGVWKTYIENGKVIKQFDFDKIQDLPTLVNVTWRYPSEARKNNVEGPVKVKVTYDNCEPLSYEILCDIGYGCGAAVVESLKEKRILEKRYGVKSIKCDLKEEIIEVQFRLAR